MLRVGDRRLSSSLWRWRPTHSSAAAALIPRLPDAAESDDSSLARPFLHSLFHLLSRGFASNSISPKDENKPTIPQIPATVAAIKNPTQKIVYDEHNHERYAPGDPSKRAFAYFVLTGGRFVYASLLRLLILKFIRPVKMFWLLLRLRLICRALNLARL